MAFLSGVHFSYRLTLEIASKHCRPLESFASSIPNHELCHTTLQAVGIVCIVGRARSQAIFFPGLPHRAWWPCWYCAWVLLTSACLARGVMEEHACVGIARVLQYGSPSTMPPGSQYDSPSTMPPGSQYGSPSTMPPWSQLVADMCTPFL
jgi:hypothetical protein